MVGKNTLLAAAAVLTLPILSNLALGDVKLPSLISDNMVLQKAAKVPVWGWAEAGEKVTVTLNGQTVETTASPAGKWMTYLDLAKSEKGPFEMMVAGQNTLTIKNVLVGEVWLASGQSNMEFSLNAVNNAQQEIASANFPEIRQFHAAYKTAIKPQDNNAGDAPGNPPGWVVSTPKTAGAFSAIGFLFAREIHQKVNTPVGIINSSWGGTPAEAWTSEETIATLPAYQNAYKLLKKIQSSDKNATKQAYDEWLHSAWPVDTGNEGLKKGWANADFDDADWKPIKVPGSMEINAKELATFDGAIWFRKEFTLTADQIKSNLKLELGKIDDFDITYINGEVVGQTNTNLEESWVMDRHYTIPAKVLKAGKNVIAIRVFDRGGGGGVGTQGNQNIMDGNKTIVTLGGTWKYNIERQVPTVDLAKAMSSRPIAFGGDQGEVTRLYNAMIHPFIPYGIAGVLWYQGEANENSGYEYRNLFPAMITDWRSHWKAAGGQAEFPFYFVLLANFYGPDDQPSNQAKWAEVRESQLAALKLPQTGTGSAMDIGDAFNIHPTNKQDVAHRLALNALAKDYGQKVEFSGPVFASKKIAGDKIIITFNHAEGLRAGRVAKDQQIKGFAIAGADGKFVWAKATLEGNTVIVSSPEIKKPTEVRYGWANNPNANLYNESGLPALPFRTDTFRLSSQPMDAK